MSCPAGTDAKEEHRLTGIEMYGPLRRVIEARVGKRYGPDVDPTDRAVELKTLLDMRADYDVLLDLLPVVGGVIELREAKETGALRGTMTDIRVACDSFSRHTSDRAMSSQVQWCEWVAGWCQRIIEDSLAAQGSERLADPLASAP